MERTYRNRNLKRIRFVAFILILLFLITAIFNTTLDSANAEKAGCTEYISVEIHDGDTLWDIANLYMSDELDTRKAVYILKKENNITGSIKPGMVIKVPLYEE